MLELIFQGLIEWIYGLILEAWEHFASSLLDLMSMDFAYLEEHIPIIPTIRQAILAIGWALLLGNLVFQAAKSMLSGLGFEGEDPKLLFTRTFVFSFLLLASPQICDLCLNMTEKMIEVLRMPTAVHITLADESAFVGLSGAWLLVVICGIIVMFKSFKLIIEMAERYFVLAMLTICAPLAFGTGGSRQTSDIFTGWCRMYGSTCLLMVLNVVFIKLLLSVLSYVPSGLDVLPWMILVLTVVKVAKKADSIIMRIGLNPAMTGDSLGGRSFPGMLTYMVARTMISNAVRSMGNGGGKNGKAGGSRNTNPNTPPGGSGTGGNPPNRGAARSGAANSRVSRGGTYSSSFNTQTGAQYRTSQQEYQNQSSAAQQGGQQSTFTEQQSAANHVSGSQVFSGSTGERAETQTRSTASGTAETQRSPGQAQTQLGRGGSGTGAGVPPQANNRAPGRNGMNTRAGVAEKNRVSPAAEGTAGKAASYSPPGTAERNAGSTQRDHAPRGTTTAPRSGMAGTERPNMPPVASITGTQVPVLDHGTAERAYETGRAQNSRPQAEESPGSGMAGSAYVDRTSPGIIGKAAPAQGHPDATHGNGEKSRRTAAPIQAKAGLNGRAETANETRRHTTPSMMDNPLRSGMAGTLERADSSRTGVTGAAAPVLSYGNNEGTGGNNRQITTEVVQREMSRSGTAGTTKAEVSDSGSGSRSTARPFGTAGNTRPGTGGNLHHDAPGQTKTGKGIGAEAKGGGMAPAERYHPDGAADTRQGPVNSTVLARDQNHVSVNQHITGASAAGDTVISPQQGSPKREQPNMGNSRSTHRPPTEKPTQRPGAAAQAPRPTDALGGKQTQASKNGTAGSAALTPKSVERNASVPGDKRPASPASSSHPGVQPTQTVWQERGGASAETHSSNREQPAFRQNEGKTPIQGSTAAMRNGKAGMAALEIPGVPNATAKQTAPVQSARSSFVTASDRISGKKTESKASGINRRFIEKANRSTKRKTRKTRGKKHGKQ